MAHARAGLNKIVDTPQLLSVLCVLDWRGRQYLQEVEYAVHATEVQDRDDLISSH